MIVLQANENMMIFLFSATSAKVAFFSAGVFCVFHSREWGLVRGKGTMAEGRFPKEDMHILMGSIGGLAANYFVRESGDSHPRWA